jgi:hypothetical protein
VTCYHIELDEDDRAALHRYGLTDQNERNPRAVVSALYRFLDECLIPDPY